MRDFTFLRPLTEAEQIERRSIMERTSKLVDLWKPNWQPETVRIVSSDTQQGYVIVNRDDFDPATMVPYVGT